MKYRVEVTITRPIREEEWDASFTTEKHLASYVEASAQRELEREIIKTLRRLDGDVDCEVLEAEIVND